MNNLLPGKWQLPTFKLVDPLDWKTPIPFPIFLKPEFGHRSYGVHVAKNMKQYKKIASMVHKSHIPYIIQWASQYKEEYEITYINNVENKQTKVYSIAKAINSKKEQNIIL